VKENNNLIETNKLSSILSSNNGPVFVLNDVSIRIKKGKVIGIIGESGSGKTQLMMALTGIQDLTPGPYKGEINFFINGKLKKCLPIFNNNQWAINQESSNLNFHRKDHLRFKKIVDENFKEIRTKKIGFIPQDPRTSLNPFWTMKTHFKQSFKKSNLTEEMGSFESFMTNYCTKVDLDYNEIKDLFPHEMSGGMSQRAMIAFVLSWQPEIIIGDECTTGLDASRQINIIEIFKDLIANNKIEITLILISHDIGFLHHLVDEYFVMYAGHVIEYITDKNRLSANEDLHPYTLDLLNSLIPNNTNEKISDDELSSLVELSTENIGCPYYNKCSKHIELKNEISLKCKEENPSETQSNLYKDIGSLSLSHDWKRCWLENE
jgi:ABC-type dipeptide/oligopeptide/nickel transport system ATPase component